MPIPAIIVDTREQRPYTFANIEADKRDGGGIVPVAVRVGTLASGDYSLDGFEDRIAVERKSLADLYGTLGKGRERFERELARLDRMDAACVIVEACWHEIIECPPVHSRLSPRSVYRSILAWSQRFPRVHWWTVADRAMGEITVYRWLERWWKDHTT